MNIRIQTRRAWLGFAAPLLVCAAFASAHGEEAGNGEALVKEKSVETYADLPYTSVLPLPEGPVNIKGKKKILVGFSQTCFTFPYRVAMLESVLAEAKRHPDVEIITTDAGCNLSKQSNDIDDLFAKGVDALIVSPLEANGLSNAVRRVMDAGKPVIAIDRDIYGPKTLFISQDNISLAKAEADQMISDIGGKGKIAEITGLSGTSVAIDRGKGLAEALKEHPDVQLVARGDGEWEREKTASVTDDFISRFPDLNAIFTHGEDMGWAAARSVARAGKCKQIGVYTIDASRAGMQSVADGQLAGNIGYSALIGDIGLRAAIYSLRGQEFPNAEKYDQPGLRLRLPNGDPVTKSNANEAIKTGWGRFAPPSNPC
jgi:ribose transport system substrate-binding protein